MPALGPDKPFREGGGAIMVAVDLGLDGSYAADMSTDTYTVERSIRIEASPQEIFALVADFRRWTEWSPWEGLDPELQRTYSGSESGPGASYRWSGNRKAGQGEMTILKAVEPSLITVDLRFDKPFKARNDMSFGIEEEGSGTAVQWAMTGKKTFVTRVMGIFKSMDALVGPDFEKGLAQLKVLAERQSDA
jgi:hypothetical protein